MTPLEIAAKYLKYPKVLVDYLNARGYTGEFWLSADKQAERMAANRKRAAKK